MRTMKTLDKLTVLLCLSVFQVNSLNAGVNDPKNYLPHWELLCEKAINICFLKNQLVGVVLEKCANC